MLQASSDSEADPPMLLNIALDVQITICTLLHPSDIIALRQTCKALQPPTWKRTVWMAALHRVCLDNSLFLPSFPTDEMSDVELEHAARAPRRWIELCAAFEKQDCDESDDAELCPRMTRYIEDSFDDIDHPELFVVPGGRYLVTDSNAEIVIWDLGYTSSADCKLIASVELEGDPNTCLVQATPDGMGLIIYSSRPNIHCSVYEIYPQNERPQLTLIGDLDFDPTQDLPVLLLPDRVLWYGFYGDRVVFIVWDYRANHSITFSADVDIKKFRYSLEVIATKTAIIVLCEREILVWAIPPLSPQPPDFFDHKPTQIQPLLRIAFPDGIFNSPDIDIWKTMSHWYSGSSQPIYFDIICRDSTLHRFEIIVKPDLFDTSLHFINTEILPHDFDNVTFERYSICEGTLVTCWEDNDVFGTYTGLTSSRFSNVISHGGPAANVFFPQMVGGYNFSLCPASGRYAHLDEDYRRIVVVDLF